jgi:hypothetical protein
LHHTQRARLRQRPTRRKRVLRPRRIGVLGGRALIARGEDIRMLGPSHSHAAAARMARHTRSGVAGISMWPTPSSASASTIALITAASAGVVPPSPRIAMSRFALAVGDRPVRGAGIDLCFCLGLCLLARLFGGHGLALQIRTAPVAMLAPRRARRSEARRGSDQGGGRRNPKRSPSTA